MNQPQFLFEYILFLCFAVLTNGVLPVLELRFFGFFTDKKVKINHYILYILFSFAISAVELKYPASSPLLLSIIRIALLWVFGTTFLKNQITVSLLTSITAKTVTLLSAGTTASVTLLLASSAPETVFHKMTIAGWMLGLLGQFLNFALMIAAYQIILRKFKWRGALPSQYLSVFFLPVLVVLMVEQYIFNEIYGNEIIIENAKILKPLADHWQMLFIQLLTCFSLFSTLYACRRLTEEFYNQTRLLLLERETAAQRDYAKEARIRYEQTQSFRHDIQHHLLVLANLLNQGNTKKAKDYLEKLEHISETLPFPCKTGNTVVDIVLGSKLSAARQNGIQIECTVKLPSPCIVDDLDLCVLFSNAVDNAVHACDKLKNESRFIGISGKQKGDFFMIEIENSCLPNGTCKKGIGLTNIEAVCEKYHGAVTIEHQENYFRLNMLLVISRHLNDISVKSH